MASSNSDAVIAPSLGSTRPPRVLLLNASLAGPTGNSAVALDLLAGHLAPAAELDHAALVGPAATDFAALAPRLRAAAAVVIATGTHWDSWSSALQRFLEDATPSEGTDLWLGKPVAILVTEHSTGGKGVLSRLQGVLSTFGALIPPMSGAVISKVAQLALHHTPDEALAGETDFWSTDDLPIIAHNLLTALRGDRDWRAWPVDRTAIHARWLGP